MPRIERITLRRLNLPLVTPYRLSYRTFDTFEPFMVELSDSDGRSGFADAHVAPGSSTETREGGWRFLGEWCERLVGAEVEGAKEAVLARFAESKVSCTALVSALEVLEGHALLAIDEETRLPLMAPVNATEPAAIEAEIAAGVARGVRCFKVKVGKDVQADLARTAVIQAAARGRASLRLDANRGFSREDGIAFASRLDPEGIELFEQPCHAEDWQANAAVAAVSPVPLMLDEPICTLDDIARAAEIDGVGFCKLKLKRFGGMDRLAEGLDAVRSHGMEWVLGDGLGSETHGWLEACVARKTLRNAGEFNGFLKAHDRILNPPLPTDAGAILLPAGYAPQPDSAAVERLTTEILRFADTRRTIHAT